MEDKETLYARWLSNDITEEELEKLQNEGVLKDLQRIVNTTDLWNLPSYDKVNGLKQIKAKQAAEVTVSKKSYWVWAMGITTVLLLLFLIFNYYKSHKTNVIIADNGTIQKHIFMDGSAVNINAGSSISYNEDLWLTNRTINLTGEAYFKVEKGTAFIVHTKNGTIEVLGTQFNVRSWGNSLYVECYEGSVKINSADQESILTLNESVSIVDALMNEKQVLNRLSPSWTNGTSRFENENINEVFLELERQYDINIKSQNSSQTFSGIFVHDNLDNALKSVCIPLGLAYKISDNQREVIIE